MKFLDKQGLKTFLTQLKNIFGVPDKTGKKRASLKVLNGIEATRKKYLLEIDYEKELAFNTDWIVGDNAPYVGSAVVGQTYVA
jgi:histidinol phosphatase-like PHP family hydrolase